MIVEQFGGIVKQCLWNGVVEQWNSESATVLSNSVGGTVKVEQCGGTVEQCWWNSGIVMVEERGDRVEQ